MTRVRRDPATFSPLTPREDEVMLCVVQGMTSRAIGKELGLSPDTARTHTQNIKIKLKAKTMAQATFIWTLARVEQMSPTRVVASTSESS